MSDQYTSNRVPLSSVLWKEAMFLDNFTCIYCGHRSADMTVDHFIPVSLGGPDVLQNLVACCSSCNSRKSNRAPYECHMTPVFGRYSYVLQQPDTQMDRSIEVFTARQQVGTTREQVAIMRARALKEQKYTWQQIADVTGMSVSTLRRRLASPPSIRRRLGQLEVIEQEV